MTDTKWGPLKTKQKTRLKDVSTSQMFWLICHIYTDCFQLLILIMFFKFTWFVCVYIKSVLLTISCQSNIFVLYWPLVHHCVWGGIQYLLLLTSCTPLCLRRNTLFVAIDLLYTLVSEEEYNSCCYWPLVHHCVWGGIQYLLLLTSSTPLCLRRNTICVVIDLLYTIVSEEECNICCYW